MPSEAFERFYFSCFDNSFGAVHDGLDHAALLSLEGAERAKAESLVLATLPTTRDSRPLIAVGLLGSPAAEEILRERLAGIDAKPTENRVWTAWALYRIQKYPLSASIILNVLN
jgi:hypothetical protein